MRKLVAGFAASVDGYIDGPDGGHDWIIVDEKIDFAAEMKRFDTFFFGRRSYEAAKALFSEPVQGITNYVFSNTLGSADPNFVLVSGDIETKIKSLKAQTGKDIALYGGAGLLAFLLNRQLVDELSISFLPVLLGSGKPMVDLLQQKVWLRFNNSRRYENGTLVVNYSVRYNRVP
ncbi:MAG: dihydrofolate reductase [Chitinophagaceae bacterium]|nr:MAG: dihydrofolate reductase [Chitinophagaceae bacterium]